MKLLITGKNGFLGSRIVSAFSNTDTCIAPTHAELDITNAVACQQALSLYQPDFVIHTAADSDVNYCETHPDTSYAVNVMGAVNLASACKLAHTRFISMSSDQVYTANHTANPNSESDLCQPTPIYGKQKLEAEQRIQEILPDAISLRLSWMYDIPTEGFSTKPNFLTQLLSAIETKQTLSYSNVEYRGITWVWEVVQNLKLALMLPGGVYNFGSFTNCTTYELAKQVFQFLEKEDEIPKLLKEREGVSPRSLAMNLDKLESHGISFSENFEGICRCLKSLHTN